LCSGGNDGRAGKCLIQWISKAGQSDEDKRTNTGSKKKTKSRLIEKQRLVQYDTPLQDSIEGIRKKNKERRQRSFYMLFVVEFANNLNPTTVNVSCFTKRKSSDALPIESYILHYKYYYYHHYHHHGGPYYSSVGLSLTP
jgi:hypothetical protein